MMACSHFFAVSSLIWDIPAGQVAGSWDCFLWSCAVLCNPPHYAKLRAPTARFAVMLTSQLMLGPLRVCSPWSSLCCKRCWSQKLSSASLLLTSCIGNCFFRRMSKGTVLRELGRAVCWSQVWMLERPSSRIPQPIRVILYSLFYSYGRSDAKKTELLAAFLCHAA